MARQCLGRRIPAIEQLSQELSVWEEERNLKQNGVDLQFTTAAARTKLKRLYPQFKS